MVLIAKLLGFILKRPEDYYDEPEPLHETQAPEDAIKDDNNAV